MLSKDFTRAVFKEVILPYVPDISSLDKNKYICDLSYHDKSQNHTSCFWYCVDVCWSRDDNTPSVSTVVCLFQCFFNHLEEILPMEEKEFNTLQNKVRSDIIEYLEKNIPDAKEQIVKYNQQYNVDLLSGDTEDWWKTFC